MSRRRQAEGIGIESGEDRRVQRGEVKTGRIGYVTWKEDEKRRKGK